MTVKTALSRFLAQEDLNFLLTNRIPRRLATRLVGWLSKIEQPLVAQSSIAVWRMFSDVELDEAEQSRFRSMHDCFIRKLKPGARPFVVEEGVIAAPSDAIVGANGIVAGDKLHQIKGFPYSLAELVGDSGEAAPYRGGRYVTLRLTAGMYHRFHAPADLTVSEVRYMSGDCWNVNPIALKRVERLFCRNERAAIHARTKEGEAVLLVAVAAVLVASIRLTFLDIEKTLREGGPRAIPLDVPLARGTEMGWFEHGSTIVMFVPAGYELAEGIGEGSRIRAGQALLRKGGGGTEAVAAD